MLDQEPYLMRYPVKRWQFSADVQGTNAEIKTNWNRNARRWDARYDADGDRNRRELPTSRVEFSRRMTYSCIFKLRKAGSDERRRTEGGS